MYHIVVTIIRRAALAAGHTSVVIFRALMRMNGPIEYDKAADLNDRPKLFLSHSLSICSDLADDGKL
jgi:hypothetical protein